MAEEQDAKKVLKKKVPTAQKRIITSKAAHARNRAFKAKVRTAINGFEKASSAGDATKELATVYSLMDQGVKKGVFKLNKASRVKSRLSNKSKAAK